jgi:ethanolamine utilization protein EutQ (cupin superfamily)
MVALTHIPKKDAYDVLPPKISENSFLGDVASAGEAKEDQITSGFFKVVPGEPLVYTYPYDELKIVLEVEGDFIVSDGEGNEVHPKAGDVLKFPKGVTITFKVEGDENAYAYNFYVGKKYFGQL